MRDLQGRILEVGQRVARAYRSGNSAELELRRVSRIEDGKLYLDGSRVPVQTFSNLLILDDVTVNA